MPKAILIADDEFDVRNILSIFLKKAGYTVTTSRDNSFINDMKATGLPDLYLLDRNLGGSDSLETCRFLKSHALSKDIPVIIISADHLVKLVYKDAGADAFISKPFDLHLLLEQVNLICPQKVS